MNDGMGTAIQEQNDFGVSQLKVPLQGPGRCGRYCWEDGGGPGDKDR